ncbi:hypothetical protein ACRTEL_08475 [Vibrio diabolicus]|uniref:hypothetical protein n=1 Tax=Vibrio diabolicus TaxID=50719 RepID=UPI003D7D0695
MKQLIPMALGLALVTSQAQTDNTLELSDINDFELAGNITQYTIPYKGHVANALKTRQKIDSVARPSYQSSDS